MLVAALAFLGYRVYDYRRERGHPLLADDPIVLQARNLCASGQRAEALALLSLSHRRDPGNPAVALEYALTLYSTGNSKAAEAAASEVLRRDPNLPEALALRGLVRRDSGRLDEGIRDLEAAVAARPDEAPFMYALAHALLMRSARQVELTAEAEADMTRATQLLQRAAALQPDPEVLSDLALLQKNRSQWPAAIETYRRLAEMLPHEAGPLAAAAECCLKTGDAQKAAEMGRGAVKRDPHYAPGHEQLARALNMLPAESVNPDEYKRALRAWWDESDANSADPALWLAEAHLRERNVQAAEAVLREAVEDERAHRHVPSPEVHTQLARLLSERGRRQEAESELATARRLHQQWDPVGDLINRITARPGHSRNERLALAGLYKKLGWPDLGLPYLRPLLNAQPPDGEAEKLAQELRDATA